MNLDNDSLQIPAAVLALTDVTCSEKMLLSFYLAIPQGKNRRALNVLGVSLAGLKKIKRRLTAKGLLHPTVAGYKVKVPGLSVEPATGVGYFVPILQGAQKPNKVAPLQRVKTLAEILCTHNDTIARITPGGIHPCTLLRVTEDTLRAIESNVPDSPVKAAAVEDFQIRCNAFYCLNYGLTNLPRKQHRDLDRLISAATPEELGRLRIGIEHGQLAEAKPTLLLEQLAGITMKKPVDSM